MEKTNVLFDIICKLNDYDDSKIKEVCFNVVKSGDLNKVSLGYINIDLNRFNWEDMNQEQTKLLWDFLAKVKLK